MKIAQYSLFISLVFVLVISNAYAENVPNWVKNTAGWWATDEISETEFVNAIEFLINEKIIHMSTITQSQSAENVPNWVKNTAGWWATDAISETEFVNAISYLIKVGIITLEKECKFNDEEYSKLSVWDRNKLCSNIDLSFVNEYVTKSKVPAIYNSEGFRGSEFLKEKPDNTYRIFAIGGSTTFGDGNMDNETWPYYLKELFNTLDLNYDVEIINAGVSSGWSGSETKMIREKILDYNPDMLLVYDGWNDIRRQLGEPQGRIAQPTEANPNLWKDRWIDLCKFTNTKNIETIITLQPFLGTGEKLYSNQEHSFRISHAKWIDTDLNEYSDYVAQLNEIGKHCTAVKDLSNIFDDVYRAIYWDLGHTGSIGNKIIATHFLKLTIPFIPNNELIDTTLTFEIIQTFLDSINEQKVIQPKSDFRGKTFEGNDFSSQDFRDSVFWFSKFENVDFSNANLENADFSFSTLTNVDFNGANLENAVFSRSDIIGQNGVFTDFSSATLTNTELSTAQIESAKFTNTIFSDSKLVGTKVFNVDFRDTNFENIVFDRLVIYKTIFTNANFINFTFSNNDMFSAVFNNLDFININWGHSNACANCDFRGSNLGEHIQNPIDISNKVSSLITFPGSTIAGIDFRNSDLKLLTFSHAVEFDSALQDKSIRVQDRVLQSVDATGANLSYQDLSGKNLTLVIFNGADMSYTNLSNADLRYSDLRNVNLMGADLMNAKLDFADLDGANLNCKNHEICVP